ncbi:MAG: hypothetical protein CBC13_00950 [Planctomycetia bacterium TMED53]|nr:MAG: hypothetical protein CBC13_00950 [Planctomycetia bacterium TMED53]
MNTRRFFTFAVLSLSLLTTSIHAQNVLNVGESISAAGSNTQVSVTIDNTAPVLGFSFGITHDGAVLTPLGIDQGAATSLLNGGSGAEYFFEDLAPANGPGVILACITTFGSSLDSIPAGTGQEIAVLNYSVSSTASPGSSNPLNPVTTLGNPATNIVFTVGGVSVFPATNAGAVNIAVPPPTTPSISSADVCTCEAVVTWTNPINYNSIEVRVAGALVQTLAGTATSATVTLPVSAESICVRGISNGTASPDACTIEGCPVFIPPAPIANLTCELTSNVPGTGCEYLLTWSGAGPYSQINVSLDGVLVDTLAGTATSATGALPFSTTGVNFTVEAIDICGGSVNTLACSLLCEEGPTFVRGDCNADGSNNIADVVAALTFLFGGGGTPLCADACDINDDGNLDISDPVFLLSNLFSNGNNPPAPYPNCGVDGTDTDPLDCVNFPPCP